MAHIKRLATPRTWNISRKDRIFVTRQMPRMPLGLSMPLGVVLRDLLGVATTMREARNILRNKSVLVDGKKRTSTKFGLGLMDVLAIKDIHKNYRMILSQKGKLMLHEITDNEASLKPGKIIRKKASAKDQFQLTMHDGRNLTVKDKDAYHVGDTILLSMPEAAEAERFPLDTGCCVYLTGGTHIGFSGVVEEIRGETLVIASKTGKFQTSKRLAFVIGKQTPKISLPE